MKEEIKPRLKENVLWILVFSIINGQKLPKSIQESPVIVWERRGRFRDVIRQPENTELQHKNKNSDHNRKRYSNIMLVMLYTYIKSSFLWKKV